MSIASPRYPGTPLRPRQLGLAPVPSLGESLLSTASFLNDVSPTFTNASADRFNPFSRTFVAAGVRRRRPLYVGGAMQVQMDLIEGARTNVCLQSQTLDNASWAKSSISVTANSDTAPDGTLTADTLTDASAGAFSNVAQTVTVANDSLTRVFSYYVKKTSGGTSATLGLNLSLTGGTPVYASHRINTDTGVVLSGSAVVVEAGGFWRVATAITNNTAGNTVLTANLYPAAQAHNGVGGDVPSAQGSAVIWGVQLEVGAFASTYIPTTTVAVTRAADVLSSSLTGLPGGGLSTTEGTVIAIGVPYSRDLPSGVVFDLAHVGDARFVMEIRAGGGLSVFYRTSSVALTETEASGVMKSYGLTWSASSVVAYRNGVQSASASPGVYGAVTSTPIGSAAGGSNSYTGYLGLFYFPRALSASEVAAVHAALRI